MGNRNEEMEMEKWEIHSEAWTPDFELATGDLDLDVDMVGFSNSEI